MIEKDKTNSNNKKKLYLSIGGISLLFIISILVISPSSYINNYSFNSIKPYYSIPEELDYEGYQKITKLETLLPGTSMVFVGENNGMRASIGTINANGFLETELLTLTDNHINPTTPFIYGTYKGAGGTYATFTIGSDYLKSEGYDNTLEMSPAQGEVSMKNWTIAINNGKTTVKRGDRYLVISANTPIFYANKTATYTTDIYVSVDSVLEQWINTYHLNQNVSGQCLTYFNDARESLLAMDSYVMANLYYNNNYSEYKERYEAWAKYHKVDPYHE